jgi:dGTPase
MDIPQAVADREALLLAPYAMHSCASAGRRHPEPPHPYRGPYERDRDRITHCAAFRRLSFKTQVFTGQRGDYHRTRLTHTLEVASIARTLARALRLHEDLVEALALTHDLGHPPFGHAGEDALDECLAGVGGFSHNRQALRIVEELEQRYPGFPGLNLTAEVREGQAARVTKASSAAGERPLLEVQVVEAADSVAYDTHDADDALELGLLALDELLATPLWAEAARRVRRRWQALAAKELTRAVLHELIAWQVGDLLEGAQARLAEWRIDSLQAVRRAELIVRPGPDLAGPKAELERLLFERVYRHESLLRERRQAQGWLRAMFSHLAARPDLLPTAFQRRAETWGVERSVGDYLAGMTDRYARQQHRRLGL